jgi:hypothetical protein
MLNFVQNELVPEPGSDIALRFEQTDTSSLAPLLSLALPTLPLRSRRSLLPNGTTERTNFNA